MRSVLNSFSVTKCQRMWGGPLTMAQRELIRRIAIPVQLRKPESEKDEALISGQLLFKWSTADPRSTFVIPMILATEDHAASSSKKGMFHQSLPAAQTFHRLHLNALDVCQLLSVLERRQSHSEIVKKRLTIRFSRDDDGSVSLSGLALPYSKIETSPSDENKFLFATILDGESQSLLKHNLDAALTEMFGIEHSWYRKAARHSHSRQVDASQPVPPPRYASELDDAEIQSSPPDVVKPAAASEQDFAAIAAADSVLSTPDAEPEVTAAVDESEVTTTKSKSKKRGKAKQMAKKKSDSEAQLLFDC